MFRKLCKDILDLMLDLFYFLLWFFLENIVIIYA